MGAKQTKIESNYFPDTPVTKCKTSIDGTDLDPRSPAGCRTPIFLQAKPIDNLEIACADMPKRNRNNEKAINGLRKRFLKSFTYSLNDPRSPSLNLNRTPIIFEDTLEKPLSLDDTFSNLFVESHLPSNRIVQSEKVTNETQDDDNDQNEEMNNEREDDDNDQKEEMNIVLVEETSPEQRTPIPLQQEFDPRSPSIGVERTPIIFTDDEIDEFNEDIMLEGIITSLSLDMNSRGVVSKKSQNENISTSELTDVQVLPVNKHLDGVRTGKKTSSKLNNIKPRGCIVQRLIYNDEQHSPMTPILKNHQSDKKNHLKGTRTPLSCLRNRKDTFVSSRSVDSSATYLKTRLALASFDDSLNSNKKNSVPKLCIMQQDSQDLN